MVKAATFWRSWATGGKKQRGIAKDLFKATRASDSFRQVQESCEYLKQNQNLPRFVAQTLWDGLVCGYDRPFGDNKNIGPANWLKIPPELKSKHDLLRKLRNEVVAHDNPGAFASAVRGGSNQLRLRKSTSGWQTRTLRIAPWSDIELLDEVARLATLLHKQADAREQQFLDDLKPPITQENGEWTVNVADDSKPLFQRERPLP